MSSRVRAVTKKTYDNLEYDVGVVAINLDITAAKTAEDIRAVIEAAKADTTEKKLLGVTRGGVSLTVDTEWREVEFDDSPGPFVGSSEKGNSTVQLEFTIIEATPENTKLAMGTADIKKVDGVTVVQERDFIDILRDYIDHLYVITRQGKDKVTVLEADNVISIGGYNETKNDAGETEINVTLQATRGNLESEGELPYRKMFFPAAAI